MAAEAAPYGAGGRSTSFVQPDGYELPLRVFGDEFFAVTETEDGFVVKFDPSSRAYMYAVLTPDGQDYLSSGVPVRKGDDPVALGFVPNLRITPESRRAKAEKQFQRYDEVVGQTAAWTRKKEATRAFRTDREMLEAQTDGPVIYAPPETSGDKVGITILVDFPDKPASIPAAEVDAMFNQPGYTGYGNKGSVFDYFYRQSARKLRYNNVVTYYVRMPQPYSYYNDTSMDSGDCGRRLLRDALDELTAAGFDFSACTVNASGYIEACNLMFAGEDSGVWAQGLWPHRWVLSPTYDVGGGKRIYDYQMTDLSTSLRIGTVCHENGHMLCKYPDFYDYDGDSNGCGKYTLMASGNHYYQTSPISVGAYLRYHSGWTDVSLLTAGMNERCSVRVDEGRIYLFDNPDASWPGEYFLLENRAKIGWEATSGLPDQGLLIMHCDESGDRDAQEMTEALHYECSIEQADNAFDLENDRDSGDAYDLFHSAGTGPKTEFSDTTGPNAKWWKGATTDTASGTPSGLNVHSVSAVGRTMTFVVGTGDPSGPATLGVDVDRLYAEAGFGGTATGLAFAVWNRQSGTLNYTVNADEPWVSVSAGSGSAITESDVIWVTLNASGLAPGAHHAAITVSGGATGSEIIDVEFEVFPPPSIALDRASVDVFAFTGSTGTTELVKVANAGGGAVDYQLSWTQPWLSASSAGGTVSLETDFVYLSLDASALGAGVHADTVTVTSATADNTPLKIPVMITLSGGPELAIGTTSLILQAESGGTAGTTLVLSNRGFSELVFQLTDDQPVGDYAWRDSRMPGGPDFAWIDISGSGSALTLSDDGESGLLALPFAFPWFGRTAAQVQVGANGVISFQAGPVAYANAALPSSTIPAESLCVLWDDLNPGAGGTIRYHGTSERMVISWLAVPFYGTANAQTFQVVLYPDGRALFQYQEVNGTLTSATVGLQDSASAGPVLDIAYNESFLEDGLAVAIDPPGDAVIVYDPAEGTVPAGGSVTIGFSGFADELPSGVSVNTLVTLVCNDVDRPSVTIPVVLTVGPPPADADGDGLPDAWEVNYFGSATNQAGTTLCANGINTLIEAYVAGFSPTDPWDGLFMEVIETDGPPLNRCMLHWLAVSGRVYDVVYSPHPFVEQIVVGTNITTGAFTNRPPGAYPSGFYGIRVRLDPGPTEY